MKHRKSLFIFRRALRLKDNTGLIKALKNSKKVIPCFIFTPEQIKNNEYKSKNAIQFMIESLLDLEEQLKKKGGELYRFFGKQDEIVERLIKQKNIDAVYVNRDYTPYAQSRNEKIKKVCKKNNIKFVSNNDYLLIEPEHIETGSGTPYKVFTPFYKKAKQKNIDKPEPNHHTNYYKGKVDFEKNKTIYNEILPEKNENLFTNGGRTEAVKILRTLHTYDDYEKERDYPKKPKTTGLSAHNKFGTISIRELYWDIADQLDKEHTLIQELFWRDFFTHVAFHNPEVFGEPFYKDFKDLKWDQDEEKFQKWCDGKTGFPIIDAGMRQLNETGWMHNRVRMIVASFLTKDLHISWQWGEKYFAQKLVDYDPAVNNGNWQWAASTGCDAQPYFRIFNPWSQQERYDKQAKYIKKWVPELKDTEAKQIHKLNENFPKDLDYPKPIVDHAQERKEALDRYKKVKGK